MRENSEFVLQPGTEANESGIFMGFWDQEKTLTVIQDLEASLNSVENKCKRLLEDLIFYQNYWEEWSNRTIIKVTPSLPESTNEITNISERHSTSVPDVTSRKVSIHLQCFEDSFRESFGKKLSSINKELLKVTRKIGLNENQFILPVDEYLAQLKAVASDNVLKYWSKVKKQFLKSYIKKSVKSDIALDVATQNRINSQISKITQKELQMYKNLSKICYMKRNTKRWRKKNVYTVVQRKKFKAKKLLLQNSGPGLKPKPRFVRSKSSVYTTTVTSSGSLSNTVNKKSSAKSSYETRNNKRQAEISKSKATISETRSSVSSLKSKSTCTSKSKPGTKQLSESTHNLDVDTICSNLINSIRNINVLKSNTNSISQEIPKNSSNLKKTVKSTKPFSTCSPKREAITPTLQQLFSLRKYMDASMISKLLAPHKVETDEPKCTISIEKRPPPTEEPTQKVTTLNTKYITTTYPFSPKWKARIEKERNSQAELPAEPTSQICTENIVVNNVKNGQVRHLINISTPKNSNSATERKLRSKYTKTAQENIEKYPKTEARSAWTFNLNNMSNNQKSNSGNVKKHHFCNNASGDGTYKVTEQKFKETWNNVLSMFSSLAK
ncbi:hypothetical protein RUM43_008587 [Polyplax serrata]|uniref:Uncharacterized protein n=1 Tax=Polyplax serrata TaxID=468196 RepID=A0AAN8RTV5_POLSC